MRRSVFDAMKLEQHAMDLFNVEKEEKELKARKAILKGRIIVLLENAGLKTYHGTSITVVHTTSHQQKFFGGVKKFTKEFGAEIAERWFKYYTSDSVKVRLKPAKKSGKTKKER